ncbi:MAG: hypothetical protein WCR51_14065, partial [Planctomycetia bacterium]
MHSRDEHFAPALRRPFGLPSGIVVRLVVGVAMALVCGVDGRAADSVPPTVGDTASAGVLAAVPARGLAAAVAEAGRIEVPSVDPGERLSIRATQAARWTEGSYDVWHLTGGVTIAQGATEARSHEAVVWIEHEGVIPEAGDEAETTPRPRGLLVRMAGEVAVTSAPTAGATPVSTVRGSRWTGRFWTYHDPALDFTSVVPATGTPAIYDAPADAGVQRAIHDGAAEGDTIQLTAAEQPAGGSAQPDVAQAQFSEFGAPAAPQVATAMATRRLRAFPRSSVPLNVRWFPSPAGGEWIAVITSGVNLVIDGVDPAGPLDISADRLVIWTRGQGQPDLDGSGAQSADTPLELYMEGNVVFRQGQR